MTQAYHKFYLPVLKLILILSIVVSVFSCKSTRQLAKEPIKEQGAEFVLGKLKEKELKFETFSAKFTLDMVVDKKKTSFRGMIRMRKDSVIWISLSPALGIEMARILISQDSVKFINRLNKEYMIADYRVVNDFLGTNVDYDVLQSILLGNDLTYYDDGKFRVSYDSKQYHLVTAGRSKLKKYIKTRDDATRIYIQNIFLDPETFKITQMKIKELTKESQKLDATYSNFQVLNEQLFPESVYYDITADNQVLINLNYSRMDINEPQRFPFSISSKYVRIK